ncbi:hypothetical protein NH340_JMT06723, partial [Sarcoptes scabiei]
MIRCSLILIAAVIVIVHLEQIDARSQKIDPDQDQFRPLKSSASSRSSISKTKLNLISGDDDHNGQPFSDQLLPLASDMIGQSASGSLMLNGYGGGYKKYKKKKKKKKKKYKKKKKKYKKKKKKY